MADEDKNDLKPGEEAAQAAPKKKVGRRNLDKAKPIKRKNLKKAAAERAAARQAAAEKKQPRKRRLEW